MGAEIGMNHLIKSYSVSFNRDPVFDIYKGILILCVIVGHVYDCRLVYHFHMPLFFIISGYLCSNSLNKKSESGKLIKRLLIPYLSWTIVAFIVNKDYHWMTVAKIFWGGRILRGVFGVWWFATCFLVTRLICDRLLFLSNKIISVICLISAFIAFAERSIFQNVPFWTNWGVPWNIDVCFLGVPLFVVGYGIKKKLRLQKKITPMYLCVAMVACFELLLVYFNKDLNIDMKWATYGNPFLFAVSVCLWGGALLLVSEKFLNVRLLNSFLALFGRLSYPVMFLHPALIKILVDCFFVTNDNILFVSVFLLSIAISVLLDRFRITRMLFITGK